MKKISAINDAYDRINIIKTQPHHMYNDGLVLREQCKKKFLLVILERRLPNVLFSLTKCILGDSTQIKKKSVLCILQR